MRRNYINKIYAHLKKYKKGITPRQAWERYGCYRLSSCICDLRKRGVDIATIMENETDADGRTYDYARYVLKKNG